MPRSALATCIFFFFKDTAPTEIYTLSLHDALPISGGATGGEMTEAELEAYVLDTNDEITDTIDRKSTRLNSSHRCNSYAVFCLKKKTTIIRRVQELYTINSHKGRVGEKQ